MYKSKSSPQIVLRPHDFVVLLRLSLSPDDMPTYAVLAAELALTASEILAALTRATLARLARKASSGKPAVVREALK